MNADTIDLRFILIALGATVYLGLIVAGIRELIVDIWQALRNG